MHEQRPQYFLGSNLPNLPTFQPSNLPTLPTMQTTILNPRARYSPEFRFFCKKYKIEPATFLSVNPKTEKSAVQTYILHLAPADTSGVNVCAGAGNCKKICLHFAGNPVYMKGKGIVLNEPSVIAVNCRF